jgi:hypothetical protein
MLYSDISLYKYLSTSRESSTLTPVDLVIYVSDMKNHLNHHHESSVRRADGKSEHSSKDDSERHRSSRKYPLFILKGSKTLGAGETEVSGPVVIARDARDHHETITGDVSTVVKPCYWCSKYKVETDTTNKVRGSKVSTKIEGGGRRSRLPTVVPLSDDEIAWLAGRGGGENLMIDFIEERKQLLGGSDKSFASQIKYLHTVSNNGTIIGHYEKKDGVMVSQTAFNLYRAMNKTDASSKIVPEVIKKHVKDTASRSMCPFHATVVEAQGDPQSKIDHLKSQVLVSSSSTVVVDDPFRVKSPQPTVSGDATSLSSTSHITGGGVASAKALKKRVELKYVKKNAAKMLRGRMEKDSLVIPQSVQFPSLLKALSSPEKNCKTNVVFPSNHVGTLDHTNRIHCASSLRNAPINTGPLQLLLKRRTEKNHIGWVRLK